MGFEAFLVPSLMQAARRNWGQVSGHWKRECKKTRAGLARVPGSENLGFLAWATALVYRCWNKSGLPSWLTTADVDAWWLRELKDRRDVGLMLTEERSRIYFGWHWSPVAVALELGAPEVRTLARAWMRAQIAQAALCAVNVRPKRYDPPVDAKLAGSPPFVPLCGARSWSSAEGRAHHMGSSAFESVVGAILFDDWEPRGPAHQWELDLMTQIGRPKLFSSSEGILLRKAITRPEDLVREAVLDIMDISGWGNSKWPCYLVRFDRGGACIGYRRAINGNTAPMYSMGVHEDGTVHYLTLDPGNRHDINIEACGMDYAPGDVSLRAWAGGGDRPVKNLEFKGSRWGQLLWIVDIGRRGGSLVWPEPGQPVPPPPEPPPDEDEDREWYDWPGIWFTKLWRWIEGKF